MISIRISNSQNTQFITVYPMEDLTIPLPAISETLQHQELSCTFKLPYDADEFAYIMAYEELNAVVYDGQTPVFTGIIKNEITWQDNGYPLPMDSISLTISDNTYLFTKKTDSEIAKINQKLDAVVQYICQNCGATIAQNQVLRQTVIQAFVLDSGKSYLEAFNNLLFQYGYAFYFNGSGEVQFVDLLAEPQQRLQLTESDLFTGLEIRKTTRNYSGVRLSYNELEKKENEQVYFEGNGVNEDSQVTPITLRPNQYYPYDSDPTQEAREGQVFQTFEDGYAESYTLYSGEQKFRRSNKTTLVYTENHRLVEDWEGSITVNRTQYGARQASVRLLNTGTTDASLYQLAIRADAYYRTQDVFLNYGDSTNPYEYQSEYIYDATSAQAFASMLTQFLMGGNFKVTAKLSVGIDVGTHVSIDTGLSGFTCNAIVLACEYDAKNQIYKCTFHSYGTASTIANRYKKYASNYGKFSEQQISVKSILSITEEYYLSTSPTVVQGGQWLPDAPEWVQGKYIWTRTKITYNSGEVTVTDPLRTTAIENVGIGSVDVEYAQTDNAVTAPTTGWSTTAPAWQQGKYIWSRTKTTLSDGTELYSNPACITGQRGETGDSIQYLGPLSALPENPKNGDFFLCVSEFSETSRLKLVNGNLLTLTDGNYLLITRGYTPKYIYAYSDGWWRVDDYNDYRYILASNDLLERGWDLSTNLQDALDTLDSDAQGYADAAQDNAKNYTDGEIQTVNNSISTLSQSVNQSISNINTSLGNKIEYVPRYLGKSATAPSGAKKEDWFLNTTAKVLQKYNGTTWDNVDQYTAENAYMYNAAATDCLELAAASGSVASYALAFIASLRTYSVEFQNFVASLQNVNTVSGDQSISMGLNPKDANDTTFNFLIQKCINKISNTEIWSKELYSELNENGNINLTTSGKIKANNGIETTGDFWSGSSPEEPDVVFNDANFSLINYSGGTVYLNDMYYAFQSGAGSSAEVYVWKSSDGKTFNRMSVASISFTSISDIVAFKNHIFLATGNGLYEFLPSGNFVLKNSNTNIKEFCNINDELLVCPASFNSQLISSDGLSFTATSQRLGYHLSKFSKDLWIGSPQFSNTMSSTGFFCVLQYANKSFRTVAEILMPGRPVSEDGVQNTITLAGQVFAANGCLYAALQSSSSRWMLGKSTDCGQTWSKVVIPDSASVSFAVAFKGFDHEGVIILYSESNILLSHNGGTDWQLLSFGGYSSILPVSPYIVKTQNRKTIRIHTANSSNRLKIVDVVQYRAFGTGHGIEKQEIGSSDFELEFSNGFVIQGGIANVTANPTHVTFKKNLKQILSLQVTPYNQPTSTANDTNYVVAPINASVSGFDLRYIDSDGTSARTGLVSWTCYGLI